MRGHSRPQFHRFHHVFVFSIYCGLDTNGADVDASTIARSLAADAFPQGHTITSATGRWTGEVGVIDEPTLVITVCGGDELKPAIKGFTTAYKQQANQESVMVTTTAASVDFI